MAFQTTDKGYDSTATAHAAPRGANGILVNHNATADQQAKGLGSIDLWIFEVGTSFAMAGSMAQSYRTRSYFPHNFVQVAITVMCQFPNQKLYANAVEWIRDIQGTLQSGTNLYITPKRNAVKGLPEPISAQGYIKSIARVHERFVYAPVMQFDFLVEQQLQPTNWADPPSNGPNKLNDWEDIISRKKPGFVRPSGDVVSVEGPTSTPTKRKKTTTRPKSSKTSGMT